MTHIDKVTVTITVNNKRTFIYVRKFDTNIN